MPAVYNKLKSLGEINNVVPLDKIIKGLQSGSARAFVSNKDRNQDGIPDNINIVYPTVDIDLSQSLSGLTSADVTAFPNVDSQKAYHVLNVLAATLEVLQHEQDHLSGFKSTESESGISEEFGSESSAHQAGHTAAQNFLNKWKNTIDSTINKGSSRKTIHINFEGDYEMRKELVKLANHLDRLGHRDLSDRIDNVLTKSASFKRYAESEQIEGLLDMILQEAIEKAFLNETGPIGNVMRNAGNGSASAFFTLSGTGHTSGQKRSGWLANDLSPTESVRSQWDAIKAKDARLTDRFAEVNAEANALNNPGAQVASGNVSTEQAAEMTPPAQAPAHDQLSTEASDNSLDGMFSVNPIGLVSR